MTRPAASTDRRAMIAKIHIARKELALDEGTYRAILTRVGGSASSKDLGPSGLDAVLVEFKRLGWKGVPATSSGKPASNKPWVRKIYAIWADLQPLLDDAGEDALSGFIVRQTKSAKNPEGIASPKWLDPHEGQKVIEGLKGWLKRVQAAKAKEAANV